MDRLTTTSNSSGKFLYEYFYSKNKEKIKSGMSEEEILCCLAECMMDKYPELQFVNENQKITISDLKKWLSFGIKIKQRAYRLGLAITDMTYEDYLDLLYSVDGRVYDYSSDEYCTYDYCKNRGYGLKKSINIYNRAKCDRNEVGLTEHFHDVVSSESAESEEDLINELVYYSGKRNTASVHGIAKLARLSQYVAIKYSGNKGIKIKMDYNGLFPKGSDLYRAVYGSLADDAYSEETKTDGEKIERQKTKGRGEGDLYNYVVKYFTDYSERLKTKYNILVGKDQVDIRYNPVQRMEVLALLYPFMLNPDKKINRSELMDFVCEKYREDKKEWESEIQEIWNEFDGVIDNIQDYMDREIKPLMESVYSSRKASMNSKSLKDLLDKYIHVINLILNEFGFPNVYPPFIGDKFFLINLLARNPLSTDYSTNIVCSIRDYTNFTDEEPPEDGFDF
jgi:hypothetical protein